MPDTTTPVLGLVKQTIGGNRNNWGGIVNSCWDLIEGAFYGMTSIVVTGSGDYTLSDAERRKRIIKITGTLTDNQIVIISNLIGRWTVRNATTGNYTLSFKTASGAAVVIPQTGNCNVWCDGADNTYADLSTRLRDTQWLAPDGSTSVPGYAFASETNSGWRRVSAAVFAFMIAATQRIRVEAAVFKVTLGSAVDVISATDTALNIGVPLTVSGERIVPVGCQVAYAGVSEPNGWVFAYGQALSRSTYSALLAAITKSGITATTNGTTGLTSLSADLRNLGFVGAYIEGTGIPTGTTITAIGAATITMSQAASGSASGVALRILPYGQGDASTTFNVPDGRGRVFPGRDDMGGTAASRLTKSRTEGIDGSKLGSTGGEQAHTSATAETPSHTHAVSPNPHSHSVALNEGSVTLESGNNNSGREPGSGLNTGTVSLTIGNTGGGEAHNNVQPSQIANIIIFTGVYA